MNQFKEKCQVQPLGKDKNEFISCIIINEQGRPLSLKRGIDQKLDPGKKDLVSGHMKKRGETPLFSLIRELTEEVGFEPQNIKEIYRLGEIETPHKALKGTVTHMYCLVTNLSIDQINQMIKTRKNLEVEEAEFLENIDMLRKELKCPEENWRVIMTEQVDKKLMQIERIIEERNKGIEK